MLVNIEKGQLQAASVDIQLCDDGIFFVFGATSCTQFNTDFDSFISFKKIYTTETLPDDGLVKIYYVISKDDRGIQQAESHQVNLKFEDTKLATDFHSNLSKYLHSSANKRFYVLVNPYGGDRKALEVYENIVEPMFTRAKIVADLVTTECHLQAQHFAHQLDLEAYDGIVSIGGDGLLHEIINGLLSRADWKRTRDFPIGVIPAGTGNAIARSIGVSDPTFATFAIIKGITNLYDAMLYEQDDGKCKRFYGHLAFLWGFIADVDVESDALRWMGHCRIFWMTLTKLFYMQKYQASISYLEAIPSGGIKEREETKQSNTNNDDSRPRTRYRKYFEAKDDDDDDDKLVKSISNQQYYSIMAVKHAYLDRDFLISNHVLKSLDNSTDLIHLFMVPVSDTGLGRWELFKAFLHNNGSIIHDDEALTTYIPVKACMISFQEAEPSIIDIDGERIPKFDVYMESIPKILCFIIPPC